jgi:phospholipase C
VVFIILMENHNWADLKVSASAPYINGTLVPMGAHAEQYYDPPKLHPSEPNYLWLEAGTNFGVTDDLPPSFNHQSTTAHLVTQLVKAGKTWKSYQEDISGMDCPLNAVNNYAPKHDPMVFFDDVTDDMDPTSMNCIQHVRPYTELAADLASGNVANYNFLTPNLCDDMHDSCPPLNDNVKQGDTWLSTEVPKLLASDAVKNGATVIVTWDEGELNLDGPIGMIVLGSHAKVGYMNSIHYDHSSTLRTIQEIMGVSPFLGGAASATDLSDLFTKLP